MNWKLLGNSLLVAGGATLGTALAGFAVALCLMGLPPRTRQFFFGGTLLALMVPPFLATNCWIYLLGWTGILNRFVPLKIYSFGGVIWITALLFWPIAAITILSAWQTLDRSLLDQEPGLRGPALIQHLLYPAARPAIAQSSLLTFALVFNHFAVPGILQVRVFPAELWVRFNATFSYWEALFLSWPMILLALAAPLWLGRARIHWPRLEELVEARLFRRRLGRTCFLGSFIFALILLLLSVALPFAQVIASGTTWRQLPSVLATAQTAFLHSLLYAAGSSALAMCAGLALWRFGSAAWLWAPFFIPGVFTGIVFIYLFNRPFLASFYQSPAVVLLALTIRHLGWGQAGARRSLSSMETGLVEDARLAGASGFQLFRFVYWPQCAAPLALCAYVIYLLGLWDTETVLLLVPPGGESLALRIFNLLHYGHNPQVNALCLLLLLAALLPWVVWQAFPSRWRARARFGCGVALALSFAAAGCSRGPERTAEKSWHSSLFSRVEIIGGRGTGPGQFNKPRSVALDAKDNLYVADMTGRVQKFSPQGAFLGLWQMPQTDLGKPKGMARDRDGNIVVVEPHYSRLNHFTPDGRLVLRWGEQGTNSGNLAFPRAVAVNSRGEIYLSEYGLVERVQRFAGPGGMLLNSFGRPGNGSGEFNRAEGLGIDRNDRVYVADSCNHRIEVFTREGDFLRAYGQPGLAPGSLSYPYDICLDRDGRQYVCEFGNSRIQIFGGSDQILEILGKTGTAPGEFNNPWSVALDSAENLYVADSLNHRVQKFIRRRSELAAP